MDFRDEGHVRLLRKVETTPGHLHNVVDIVTTLTNEGDGLIGYTIRDDGHDFISDIHVGELCGLLLVLRVFRFPIYRFSSTRVTVVHSFPPN